MRLLDRLTPQYDGALGATIRGIVDRVHDRDAGLALDPGDAVAGKTCLVTGGNRGLGLAVARDLARRGGRVVLACRSGLDAAVGDVRRAGAAAAVVEGVTLDLRELASVEEATGALARSGAPVDVAVLNAGIVPREARRTRDGFDESFQVNFLANALLARRLVEAAGSSRADGAPAPRLVVVSSEAHRSAPPIDWARLGQYQPWGMWEAVAQYGSAKLLLQTFVEELARRTCGRVAVHSLCPGAMRTGIAREAPRWAKPALDVTMRAFFKDPADAAIPVVYLAAARAIEGETGTYLHARRKRDPSAAARDEGNGRRVWDAAERLLTEAGHGFSSPAEERWTGAPAS